VAGAEQRPDDLRVEHGAALRDAGDGLEEVADVGDAVFQQVAHARRGPGEQLGRGPGLDVLGEDEHADLRMVVMDRLGSAQSLVGVGGRRHPLGIGLSAAANGAGAAATTIPPAWWLLVAVLGTLLAVAALAIIPARIGARRPAGEILQAETA
jgi:hypothetical protein